MGSARRSGRASCVGAKLWFNGSNPVKPPRLTWPSRTSELGKHVSALYPDYRRESNCPEVTVTRQDRCTPCRSICERQMTRATLHAMTHRWKPARPEVVTTSPARVRACAPCSSCKGVLWARKYTHGETAVLTFSGKGGGRRRGALTNVWCMLLWRQQRSESSGLSVTDNPDKSSALQPLSPGLIHSSPPYVAFEKALWDMILAFGGISFQADWSLSRTDFINTHPRSNKWR